MYDHIAIVLAHNIGHYLIFSRNNVFFLNSIPASGGDETLGYNNSSEWLLPIPLLGYDQNLFNEMELSQRKLKFPMNFWPLIFMKMGLELRLDF